MPPNPLSDNVPLHSFCQLWVQVAVLFTNWGHRSAGNQGIICLAHTWSCCPVMPLTPPLLHTSLDAATSRLTQPRSIPSRGADRVAARSDAELSWLKRGASDCKRKSKKEKQDRKGGPWAAGVSWWVSAAGPMWDALKWAEITRRRWVWTDTLMFLRFQISSKEILKANRTAVFFCFSFLQFLNNAQMCF